MFEFLEAYHLRIVLEGDHACLYQLVPPDGTEAESVRLAFLGPECPTIIIYGDLCPGVNGAVSATGYGLGWFIAAGGDYYLLSKFLTKSLQWDSIVAYIDDRLKDGAEEGDDVSEWKHLQEQVSDGEFSYDGHDTERLYQAVLDLDSDAYDACTGYDARDKALILRVRSVFRRLYTELEQQRDLEQKMGESRRLIAASADKDDAGVVENPPWWKRALTWLFAPRPGYRTPPPTLPLPTPPRTMEPPKSHHRNNQP